MEKFKKVLFLLLYEGCVVNVVGSDIVFDIIIGLIGVYNFVFFFIILYKLLFMEFMIEM